MDDAHSRYTIYERRSVAEVLVWENGEATVIWKHKDRSRDYPSLDDVEQYIKTVAGFTLEPVEESSNDE